MLSCRKAQLCPPMNSTLLQLLDSTNDNGYIYQGQISLEIERGQDNQGLGSGH